MARLVPGTRVQTSRGPGQIVTFQNARDWVPPHGKPVRGIAWAVVALDRGGRRIFAARELDALEK